MNQHMMYLAAVAWANGGTLRGANLMGANLGGAYLSRASLESADLAGASLESADLAGASLDGAEVAGASLEGAEVAGASLEGIATAERMDGYTFHLFRLKDGTHKVMAGCRWLTIPDYRAHVAAQYPDTDKARETLDILDYFERRAA